MLFSVYLGAFLFGLFFVWLIVLFWCFDFFEGEVRGGVFFHLIKKKKKKLLSVTNTILNDSHFVREYHDKKKVYNL